MPGRLPTGSGRRLARISRVAFSPILSITARRQDLTPWLAALYIDEPARGKGLGGILQEHVAGAARQAGFDALYLYSACRDYYERFGWGYIGDGLEYPDKTVHLYHKAL